MGEKSFIEDFLEQVGNARFGIKSGKTEVAPNPDIVIRVETASGSEKPRKFKIVSLGKDFMVVRGRDSNKNETFSLHHITNWRFEPHNPAEWRWQWENSVQ